MEVRAGNPARNRDAPVRQRRAERPFPYASSALSVVSTSDFGFKSQGRRSKVQSPGEGVILPNEAVLNSNTHAQLGSRRAGARCSVSGPPSGCRAIGFCETKPTGEQPGISDFRGPLAHAQLTMIRFCQTKPSGRQPTVAPDRHNSLSPSRMPTAGDQRRLGQSEGILPNEAILNPQMSRLFLKHQDERTVCRLQARDTADCKSALQRLAVPTSEFGLNPNAIDSSNRAGRVLGAPPVGCRAIGFCQTKPSERNREAQISDNQSRTANRRCWDFSKRSHWEGSRLTDGTGRGGKGQGMRGATATAGDDPGRAGHGRLQSGASGPCPGARVCDPQRPALVHGSSCRPAGTANWTLLRVTDPRSVGFRGQCQDAPPPILPKIYSVSPLRLVASVGKIT